MSLWVGVAGLILTTILTVLVWIIAKTFAVPMDFPLFIDIPVGIALLILAVLSGIFSMCVLNKEPAGGFTVMSSLALDAKGLGKAYKIGKLQQQVLKDVDFNA